MNIKRTKNNAENIKEEIIKGIIEDFKNILEQEDLQDTIIVSQDLLEPNQSDKLLEDLKLLKYKPIINLDQLLQNNLFKGFLESELNSGYKVINLTFTDEKDKKSKRDVIYIPRQEKHNYSVLWLVDTISNNFIKKTFKKQPFKEIRTQMFIKGECEYVK